jgi:hypothetical protein
MFGKRGAGGVPSQRETHRKSGSPDRTAPSTPPPDVAQGSKPTSGPPAESENRPKKRRGSTGKARAASPADWNREGTAGPPACKNSKFRAAETAVIARNYRHARRSSKSAPECPPPAKTNGELTANRGGASPKGRDRLRPSPTP